MNSEQQKRWRFEEINHILLAMAASQKLRDNLVFKGALILDRRLGTSRVSLDIDANMDAGLADLHPDRERQKAFLDEHVGKAVSRYFESQDPVRYELEGLRIDLKPREHHPRGWNALIITLSLVDHKNVGIRGVPKVEIDVAAPERLSGKSIDDMELDGVTIRAYTLERIAGEKARAFLSTLPSYREKMKKPGEAVRVKDLYDLTRIIEARPISDSRFWTIAGEEFQLACESRYVDCVGLESFKEGWAETRVLFEKNRAISKDCIFEDVERTIVAIAEFWRKSGLLPFVFPLP